MKNSMSYNKLVCLPRSSLLCDSQSPGVCLYFHSFMVGHEFHSHCDEETEEEGDGKRGGAECRAHSKM